jgi:fluoroquinolone transport system permease protein
MFNQTAVKADLKLIFREPILILFMSLPLLIILIVKSFVVFGTPLLLQFASFDIAPYYGYLLALTLLMAPFMLGAVCGFLMIDDRDARLLELMSVTPLGYLGYIFMRALIPLSAAFVYTIIGYYVIAIVSIHFTLLVYIALLNSINGVLIAFFLFTFAEDKVKGIAYAKGLSMLNVLAVADLFNLPWLSFIGSLTPFYWVVRLINSPLTALNLFLAAVVHLTWLAIMFRLMCRRHKNG